LKVSNVAQNFVQSSTFLVAFNKILSYIALNPAHIVSIMTTVKTTSLLEETRELLKHRPASLTMATISNDTGYSIAWLRLFAKSTPNDTDRFGPGVIATQNLNAYLKNYKPR
jgi:hypothetical protein